MPNPTDFNTGPNLEDPKELSDALASIAAAMRQQGVSARGNTALGGHPDPVFFFTNSAHLIEAGVAMIRRQIPAPAPIKPTDVSGPAVNEGKPEPKPAPAAAPKPKAPVG